MVTSAPRCAPYSDVLTPCHDVTPQQSASPGLRRHQLVIHRRHGLLRRQQRLYTDSTGSVASSQASAASSEATAVAGTRSASDDTRMTSPRHGASSSSSRVTFSEPLHDALDAPSNAFPVATTAAAAVGNSVQRLRRQSSLLLEKFVNSLRIKGNRLVCVLLSAIVLLCPT